MPNLTNEFEKIITDVNTTPEVFNDNVSKLLEVIPLDESDRLRFLRIALNQTVKKIDHDILKDFLFEIMFFTDLSVHEDFQDSELSVRLDFYNDGGVITSLSADSSASVDLISAVDGLNVTLTDGLEWTSRYIHALQSDHLYDDEVVMNFSGSYSNLLNDYVQTTHSLDAKTIKLIEDYFNGNKSITFLRELVNFLKEHNLIVEGSCLDPYTIANRVFDSGDNNLHFAISHLIKERHAEVFSFCKIDLKTGLAEMVTPKVVKDVISSQELCELIDLSTLVYHTNSCF